MFANISRTALLRLRIAQALFKQPVRNCIEGPLGHIVESEEEFNQRYVKLLSADPMDGWTLRQAMNDIAGMDLYVDPSIVIAGLHACRKVNDFALAIRWMELVKDKCADEEQTLYPEIISQIKPTLDELGIPTIEELGYDKPELAFESVHDM